MGVETDREELGREICPCSKTLPGDHAPHLDQVCAWADDLANSVVESRWLAARDAELIAATRKQVLGEAVEAIEAERDRLWTGSQPGTHFGGLSNALDTLANLRDGGEQ